MAPKHLLHSVTESELKCPNPTT